MADGPFAILMFIVGLSDMGQNYCGTETGCLGRSDVTPRVALSFGEFDDPATRSDKELYVRYDLGHRNGPFGHAIGLSVADRSLSPRKQSTKRSGVS